MSKNQSIPATLRAIRAKLGLTQEQLAERLGVSFATVNRWEGGSNGPQKAAREVIDALAAEAGVSAEEQPPEASEAAAAVTRRRRSTSAPSTKSMEQMLWDAACSIRGEKDAAKFKDYLLPLLFLKRLSDVFEDEITRLAEEYGDRDTALEIAEGDHSLLRFYLPPEARWGIISGRQSYDWPLDDKDEPTKPKDIGEHLTKAVRAVVKQNPSLSGVIDVVDFAAERNGERDVNPAKLREVIETFSDARYRLGLADVQPDFLGRAYEYLLRKFAEGSGQSAGEFFTPTEVGFLMAHIMRPRPGEQCHDYACGSAGLLVKLQLVARELDPTSKVPLKLTGQELQAESYAVAQMNGIIHDMDIEIARGDTMINPKFRTADGKVMTHDIVVANPMWNQPFNPDIFKDDPFDRFRTSGGVSTGKGDWAWLQHTLACLNDNGRAAIVLDTGAVTRGSGSKNEDKERNIRKWFVDHDLIDGVILLPENLFYNTGAPGVIVVLTKRKTLARKGKIVLLNASKRLKKGKPKNYIPEDAIRPLALAFLNGEPIEGELAVIDRQRIKEADYNLSPSRWVGHSSKAVHGKLTDIIEQIAALSREETALDKKLLAIMKPLANRAERESERPRKESDFGPISAAWSVSPIGDFTKQTQYGLSIRGESQGQYPILRMNCQQDGKVIMRDLQYVDLDADTAAAYRLNANDILFNRTNSYELVGRTAIVEQDSNAVFASYLVRVTVDGSRLDPRYLNHVLNWSVAQSELKKLASRGVSQANISASKLRDFAIPIPPTLNEQQVIVSVIDTIKRKIDLNERQRLALGELLESALHKLLSGEISTNDHVSSLAHCDGDNVE
ncbi:N-6 DNA methylase [Bradyrhizobium symbiodeficiens]|uniref:N-6 DNA methylase n=1 Tax=Bradyrhizobium symbiodeficiens TaxID=1404367 RepID=UPI0030D1457B